MEPSQQVYIPPRPSANPVAALAAATKAAISSINNYHNPIVHRRTDDNPILLPTGTTIANVSLNKKRPSSQLETDKKSGDKSDNEEEDLSTLNVTEAEAWPDPGEYYLDVPTVHYIASELLDHEGRRIRLNNRESLWYALEYLKLNGLKIRRKFRLPPHVVAVKSWDAALTNAIMYAQMSVSEQTLERARYRVTPDHLKERWRYLTNRLHLDRNRVSIRAPKLTREQKKLMELVPHRADGKMDLNAFISHSKDPERVARIRELVGYAPPPGGYTADDEQKIREALLKEAKGDKKNGDYRRSFGDAPRTVGQQTDSKARFARNSAIKRTAKYIQTVHYPYERREDQGLHTMVLVIYNNVEKQVNYAGGRLKKGKKAEVYELTVLAYDVETCSMILRVLNDQFGERGEGDPPRPACTKHFIKKEEGKTLVESVDAFLSDDLNRAQPRRNRPPPVTVCVGCKTDLTKTSYAQLVDKSTFIFCPHALCMMCFGRAHAERAVSGEPGLKCLSETCNHSSLAWKIVTFDGTQHIDPVEQDIPHQPNPNVPEIPPDEEEPKAPRKYRKRVPKMDQEEAMEHNWQDPYEEEMMPPILPEGLTEAKKEARRNYGDPPRSVGGQVDSIARRAKQSAISKNGKYLQTIHFPNNGDQEIPLHTMMLIVYNDVAKQTNFTGGRLCDKKRESYDLTVLAYDEETCGRILKALNDQCGYPNLATPPPCNKQFIQKMEGLSLEESAEAFLAHEAKVAEAQAQQSKNEEGKEVGEEGNQFV